MQDDRQQANSFIIKEAEKKGFSHEATTQIISHDPTSLSLEYWEEFPDIETAAAEIGSMMAIQPYDILGEELEFIKTFHGAAYEAFYQLPSGGAVIYWGEYWGG